MSRRTLALAQVVVLATLPLLGCEGGLPGDPPAGSWSGAISCEGHKAYLDFHLGGGAVSDVTYDCAYIGAHGCEGEGEYEYTEEDGSFFMEIRYDDCQVEVGWLVKDHFWGEYDGAGTLNGDLGGSGICSFEFSR